MNIKKCRSNGRFWRIKCAVGEGAVLTEDSLTAHFIGQTSGGRKYLRRPKSLSPNSSKAGWPRYKIGPMGVYGCLGRYSCFLEWEHRNAILKIYVSKLKRRQPINPQCTLGAVTCFCCEFSISARPRLLSKRPLPLCVDPHGRGCGE